MLISNAYSYVSECHKIHALDLSVPRQCLASSSMAPVRWVNLPTDIILIIATILDSDIDLLRLASVCSSWRSSVLTRIKQWSFPVKVPPLLSSPDSPNLRHVGSLFLNYSTLYRLSHPKYAGGWLFRVLEVNPSTFSLVTPLFPKKFKLRPGMIPKNFSLLDYQISKICKCYHLNSVDFKGALNQFGDIKKVIVLWDFVADCDFVVLVLVSEQDLRYWKFGEEDWIQIDTKGYVFDDVILYNRKCYAIGWQGELVSFDSEFNLKEVCSSLDLVFKTNNFVEYKSDLYVVSKTNDREPADSSSDEGSSDEEEVDCVDIRLKMKVFKMSKTNDRESAESSWEYLKYLEDDVMFLSSDDVSVGVSTKDFGDCKGNCVYYVAQRRFISDGKGIAYDDHLGVYYFNKRGTRSLEKAHNHLKIVWPPPDWLYD